MQWLALSAILLTNFVFAWKYLDRLSPLLALPIAFLYSLFLLALALFWNKLKLPLSNTWLAIATAIVLMLFSYIVFQKIDPLSIKVDRWSVISSFWDASYNGQYPYFAKSHMNSPPGPLPVYFLLGLPFYLIGEIGWYAVAGLLLFLWFLHHKQDQIKFTTVLILCFCSLAVLYEILVRSTIFTNSVIFLLFLDRIKTYGYKGNSQVFWIGLCAGILLSTRMVYGLCFAVYIIYGLHSKQISLVHSILWGAASIIGLSITLIPIYLAFPQEFLIQNPFNIQGTFLIEPYWQPVFLLMAICLGWFCKQNNHLNFMYGILLFLVLFIYVTSHVYSLGFEAILNGRIDISYLLFCFPFLLYFLSLKQTSTPSTGQQEIQ